MDLTVYIFCTHRQQVVLKVMKILTLTSLTTGVFSTNFFLIILHIYITLTLVKNRHYLRNNFVTIYTKRTSKISGPNRFLLV